MPEIKRCNLSNVILHLKALGIGDIIGFDFIEQPDRIVIIKSMELLFLSGALTEASKLSYPVGQKMARLPPDPIYSKALIIFRIALRSFSSPEADHLTLLNVYRASDEFLQKSNLVNSKEKAEKNLRKWCKENFINSRSLKHARDIHSQIRRNAEQMGLRVTSCGDDMLPFRRALSYSANPSIICFIPDETRVHTF
ncbi:unnamed protein product [Fraxinus pennsylvanica]|uniref:RNA helicase n=1 Tax=Fraxinus pennsylvanica TaxID=56036 RepID=A0AAD2A665_9LAMI|nr:unnamed protein product [Fraxinus pennsylvanica]